MSTMTSDRMMGMMPMSMPGMMMNPMAGMQMPMGMGAMNGMMIPRCTMKMEKCPGGMKMMCVCDDATAAAMMQNMCKMMSGGMMSCCCMMNGQMVCMCNMSMGTCKCEMMDMGVMMTCTSGDKMAEKMIQACCDCMMGMMMPGCMMMMCMNGMPMCCCMC